MPTLSNPRHERFAQELVTGKSAAEAYISAGYTDNRHNAAALTRKQHISTRVAELLKRSAAKALVTVDSIAAELDEARRLALRNGQAAAAVSASMGKAKLYGLIVEKRESGEPGEFDRMSDEELDAFIRGEAEAQAPHKAQKRRTGLH